MFAIAGQQPPQQFGLPHQSYQMQPQTNPQTQQFTQNHQEAQWAREVSLVLEQINYLQGDYSLKGYMTLTHHIQTMNASSLTLATG